MVPGLIPQSQYLTGPTGRGLSAANSQTPTELEARQEGKAQDRAATSTGRTWSAGTTKQVCMCTRMRDTTAEAAVDGCLEPLAWKALLSGGRASGSGGQTPCPTEPLTLEQSLLRCHAERPRQLHVSGTPCQLGNSMCLSSSFQVGRHA